MYKLIIVFILAFSMIIFSESIELENYENLNFIYEIAYFKLNIIEEKETLKSYNNISFMKKNKIISDKNENYLGVLDTKICGKIKITLENNLYLLVEYNDLYNIKKSKKIFLKDKEKFYYLLNFLYKELIENYTKEDIVLVDTYTYTQKLKLIEKISYGDFVYVGFNINNYYSHNISNEKKDNKNYNNMENFIFYLKNIIEENGIFLNKDLSSCYFD